MRISAHDLSLLPYCAAARVVTCAAAHHSRFVLPIDQSTSAMVSCLCLRATSANAIRWPDCVWTIPRRNI